MTVVHLIIDDAMEGPDLGIHILADQDYDPVDPFESQPKAIQAMLVMMDAVSRHSDHVECFETAGESDEALKRKLL